jgi:hypothetical protein
MRWGGRKGQLSWLGRGRGEAHLADSSDGSFISHVSFEEANRLGVEGSELLARVGEV